jgi:AraC-like DNA-binding protein
VSKEYRKAPLSYVQLTLRRLATDPEVRAQVLSGVNLSPDEAEDPNTEIAYTQLARMAENMTARFGGGWIIAIPELWRPPAHGALSAAGLSSPTVGLAMEVLAKYMAARFAIMRLAVKREAGGLTLRPTPIVPLSEPVVQTYAEFCLLSLSASLETLAGGARAQARFEFSVPRPAYAERLETALGADTVWEAPFNAVWLPGPLLAVRSPMADAALHAAAIEQLEAALRSHGRPQGVKGRVERLLARSETGREPIEVAAGSLGLSRRTLVRRLADTGFSYRALVDAEQKARARRWLDSGALSKAQISDRLGFADVTGFSRASRRWFKADPEA